MLDDHDLQLEEPGNPSPEHSGPANVPVIVLQRRGSGLLRVLVLPALILAASVAILSYRVQAPDWRGLELGESPAVAQAKPTKVKRVTPAEPIIVRAESGGSESDPAPEPPADLPPPTPPSAVPPALAFHPVAKIKPSPLDLSARPEPALEPEPEPIAPLPALEPDPLPPAGPAAARAAWDDIQRESRRKQAEIDKLNQLKREAPVRARLEERRRDFERLRQARTQVEADRLEFQGELRTLLKQFGSRSAPFIQKLSDRYGRSTQPEFTTAAAKAMSELAVSDRLGRIRVGRLAGLPEPSILDILIQYEIRQMASRNGPRNINDALIRAAKVSLAVPLPASSSQPVARQVSTPRPLSDSGH
ncbi:MAG: hypothetical protein ABI353_17925 [Isosphaeraceae bacterium]